MDYLHFLKQARTNRLKLWPSVLEEHLEVCLVPLTSLRRWLERIGVTAERVVTDGRAVGGTIRLTTGLDPDKGVDERVVSPGGGADTETGTVNIAPVAPCLTETLNGVAASIDDSLAGHAGGLELGREELDVQFLVLGLLYCASASLENSPGLRS